MAESNTVDKDAPAATPILQYMPMDEISRYVEAYGSIDLDQMPAVYEETGRFELPVVDPNKTRKLDLGKGREKDIPVDIGWANRNKYRYAWLDESTKMNPKFAGFIPLKKDSPAAYAGGKAIPDRYFGGKSYIAHGEVILHYAKVEFAQSVKDATNKRALDKLKSLQPGETSVSVKDEAGQSAGGVKTTKFSSGGFSEEE